jgi:hypothetical protein
MLKRINDHKRVMDDYGGTNTRLEDLANGNIVRPDHIRNLVEPGLESKVHACYHKCGGGYEQPSNVSDHGVFVADIIKDIAPEAEIWVYRVLDDWGVGNQERLAAAVQQALRDAQDDPPDWLVLNLSLGIGPPAALMQAIMTNPDATFDRDSWDQNALNALNASSLAGAVQVRDDPAMMAANTLFGQKNLPQNVLVIAAAGNDSCRPDVTNPASVGLMPRFPAIAEDVIGVSAVQNSFGHWCAFSNHDDAVNPPDDGVAASGQDIVGLYTYPLVEGQPNRSGWARWSGTSFATPVVSGLAAKLFRRGRDRDQVQKDLIVDPATSGPRPFWDLFQV